MKIFATIEAALSASKPFVAYRKPNENTLQLIVQQTAEIHYSKNLKESGFVFAPFDDHKKTVVFPLSLSEYFSEELKNEFKDANSVVQKTISDKTTHVNLVEKAVNQIKNSDLQKVVLSRVEEVQVKEFNSIQTFKNLLSLYKNAMVYVWYHPEIGLWLGATPELLLQQKDNQFFTVALASTQPFEANKNVSWSEKEIEEHQIVVKYIKQALEEINLKEFSVSKTETIQAGSLLHLKAIINGKCAANDLHTLVKALHPTPAVCGLPKQQAKDFILQNEKYNRSFYTGFLGEINMNNSSNLYVNLRCVEAVQNKLKIYVGGGIVKNSKPEKEWQETHSKTNTIKKAI